MSDKKKKAIKRITKTFNWKPTPAIEWVLKTDRAKFMKTNEYAPLSILMEELGWLHEARGQLFLMNKDENTKDERTWELRERINYIEERIKMKHYDMLETIDRMHHHEMLEAVERKNTESK